MALSSILISSGVASVRSVLKAVARKVLIPGKRVTSKVFVFAIDSLVSWRVSSETSLPF